jgi:hypothetical protein
LLLHQEKVPITDRKDVQPAEENGYPYIKQDRQPSYQRESETDRRGEWGYGGWEVLRERIAAQERNPKTRKDSSMGMGRMGEEYGQKR